MERRRSAVGRVVEASSIGLAAIVTALAVASTAAATSDASREASDDASPANIAPARAEALVREVAPEVESIRGRSFRRAVPVRVIDDAEAAEHVRERIFKFQTVEDLERDAVALATMGLASDDVDLMELYLGVLEEQAGGYYDPELGAFFLLDDMPARSASILVAHELTHALEDQVYGLDRRIEAVMDDADALFAHAAVHEGSATLVMTVYATRAMLAGDLAIGDLATLRDAAAANGPALESLPEILKRQLLGSYLLGASFLVEGDAMRLARGFPTENVDRAFRDGPASSEQILHPEKYWDASLRDDPSSVELAPVGRALGRGFSKVRSGVLGELGIAALFGGRAPVAPGPDGLVDASEWTHPAAVGWGGDRWALYVREGRGSSGRSAVVLLSTVWDDAAEAEEFERALREVERLPVVSTRREGTRVGVAFGDASETRARKALSRVMRRR